MADSDEALDGSDIARDEALRAQALSGEPASFRQGLALLQGRGVAVWLRAGRGTPATASPSSARPVVSEGVGGDLVGVLAAMALAVVG